MIQQKVNEIFKSGKDDYAALAHLRGQFGDEDVVDAVFEAYKDRQEMLVNKARKFKELIMSRYSSHNLSFPDLLKKARKYKKKYELSDSEFQYFLNLALTDKLYKNLQFMLPNTTMSRTLGYGATLATSDRLRVPANEMDVLQDILKMHGETRTLHSNLVLQTLEYKDCAPEALVGQFRPQRDDPYSYVHPIVAALFLPKVQVLEEHMLLSNMAELIKRKHEGKQLLTKPNFDLYWSLITDPNDTVCDLESPMRDLKTRVQLQTRLYDSVLNLRQGKYYQDKLNEFLVALDSCKNNIYDAPDLTYVKDEGTMLRRLLGAFSLRPTTVSTVPFFGYVTSNPHISPRSVNQVTHVPMITMRLPHGGSKSGLSVHLKEAISQAQWYVENRMLVPKTQNIIMSREVLFFYVGRRYQTINVGRASHPYNFTKLPMTVSGHEALNDMTVNYDEVIQLGDESFQLRSVVFVERSKAMKNLITGCTAGIIQPLDIPNGRYEEGCFLYDPQGAAIMENMGSGSEYKRNPPITQIPKTDPWENVGHVESFSTAASTRGTIFMYQRIKNL
ncbi:MAG: hypothetical protein CMF62_00440 [Magnetococcales bacterium]|nr:hypothetical protein [Magnetococcales bacterium]